MVSGCQMLAVAGLSQAMGVESFSGWILDTTMFNTRLRTNCGSLNNDLFLKNISESPLCSCGSVENTQHFFLRCPRYIEHRTLLLNEVSSTSQFLSICYYMEVVHFHMKPMLSSFKWYISTYQTLSVLLNIHLNCS